MEKIDIHCHTTKRPLPKTACPDASLAEIDRQMRMHDISHTLLYASYFPHRGSGITNFRLQHWIAEQTARERPEHAAHAAPELGRYGLVGSLDMGHYFRQGVSELEELAEARALRGIKIYTGYQEVDLAGRKLEEVFRLAATARIPLFFHTGYSYCAMRTTGNPSYAGFVNPTDISRLADRHPENDLVICHLGKPFFKETIEALRNSSNIWTDTSGLLDSKHEADEVSLCAQELRRVVHEAGPRNILFGSDFPVESHEHAVIIAETALLGLTAAEQRQVYSGNALRLLGGRV